MNVVNNVDMSSLRAPWQNGPYESQYKEQHKTQRTPRRNRLSEKKTQLFFVFNKSLKNVVHVGVRLAAVRSSSSKLDWRTRNLANDDYARLTGLTDLSNIHESRVRSVYRRPASKAWTRATQQRIGHLLHQV